MKRHVKAALLAGLVITGFLLAGPASSNAGVDISISIPLPGIVISGPPALVVIPGTQVYYVPDIEPEVIFYGGYWYRPHLGHWYIAAGYGGPWYYVAPQRVPVVVLKRPVGYRYGHVRHGQVSVREALQERRSWDRSWENDHDRNDRRWENDHRGRSHDKRFYRDDGRGRGSRWDD